jgi:DNA-binding NarL/FixJ family response regulator
VEAVKQQNALDQRWPRLGEAHPQAKLTDDKVRQIITLLVEGQGHRNIAEQLGVEHTTIGRIARGQAWPHIPRPPNFENLIRHSRAKLTESQVREIRRLKKEGLADREIASRFGVTRSAVGRIASGKHWAWLIDE